MTTTPQPRGGLTSRSDLYDAFHRGLLQRKRLLKLTTPLGADVLIPLRAQGWAKLGRDYRWIIDAASMRADIELLSLMHQPVTLWIQQTTEPYTPSVYRPVHGFVHRIKALGADGDLAVYQLEFSSALFFLGPTRNDRYWIDHDAREILFDVFARYPQLQGRVHVNIWSTPRVRSYCRQAESDLNFVHRILEDEGWYCYWKHSEEKPGVASETTLMIVDRLHALPDAKAINYTQNNPKDETNGLTEWVAVQTLQSTSYATHSFNYKQPWLTVSASSELMSRSYVVDKYREHDPTRIPAVPMEVFESLPYAYSSWDAGAQHARLRTDAWDAQACRYTGAGGLRWIDAGSRFVLNRHPRHTDYQAHKREFVAVELRWTIENNVPIRRRDAHLPHSLQRVIADARLAHGSRFETRPHPVDGEAGYFVVQLDAQQTTREYRSPLEHRKPTMHIEHATVVAPEGEEAWADALNRIYVRYAWDRQTQPDVFCSSPLLLSLQADTGEAYGAVHVPRAGEVVAIDHWGGDCDRPFVLGRINSGATPPPWHTNVVLSGFQSRGFGKTRAFNALVHDDAAHQGGTRLTSFSGKSYSTFSQGYLIRQDGNTRGAYLGNGFLLHTDDYGALRANRGLYLSTHATSVDGIQLDVDQLHDQLNRAEMLVEALSTASATAQAESLQASRDALKAVISKTRQVVSAQILGGRTGGGGMGDANAFTSPLIVMASPAGIGLSTQQSAQVTADQQVNVVSGEDSYFAAGRSLIMAAAEKLSAFVQKGGMKLIAAKGKVELAAQRDEMELYADKQMKIKSNDGRVVIEAKEELMLKCGGSYIRITADGIEDGSHGARTFKVPTIDKVGPGSVAQHMNGLQQADFNDPYVLRDRYTGEVLKNHAYELIRGDGTRLTGKTNELGHVPEQKNEDVERMAVNILRFGSNPGGKSA